MHGGEEDRVRRQADGAPEVSPHDAVEEEPKDEFLDDRRDRDREDDDQHALLERLRLVEQLDDALPAGVAAEEAARREIGQKDQRIGGEKQDARR